MKTLLFFLRFLCATAILFLCYLNVRLYDETQGLGLRPSGYLHVEVLDQLHFLKRAIRTEKADEAMQLDYPEGYVFMHALYALAWCDIVANLPPESTTWQEGMGEIGKSVQALNSKKATATFNAELSPAYGAFYQGWATYVQGRMLQLQPPDQRDTGYIQQFQQRCQNIVYALGKTDQPYLASYPGQTWPADNIICLAAVSLHDRLFTPKFQEPRTIWLKRIKRSLSENYETIPHAFDLDTKRILEDSRGASMALMLCFLPEIDSAFARVQYQQFRQYFLDDRLGLPGIREYPKGSDGGSGDVDSGPIVAGIGGAASIVGIRVMGLYGDGPTHNGLQKGIEALLFPWHSRQEKQYFFGQIPMVDAFMAWSQAPAFHHYLADDGRWRQRCHGFSAAIVVLLAGILWVSRRIS